MGGVLTILGGVLIGVSAFLDWGKITNTTNGASAPVEGGTGVLLASGGVAVVLGLALLFVAGRGARLGIGILTLLGGLLALAVSLIFITSDDVFISSIVEGNPGILEADVKAAFDEGTLSGSRSAGVFIALGGSVLVLLGGILGLRRGPKTAAPAAPTAPGAGYPAPPASYPPQQGYPPAAPPAAPPTAPPSAPPPSGPPPPPPQAPPPQAPPLQAPPGGYSG